MQRTTLRKDTRLLITLELLNKIIPTLQTICNTAYETKLFAAAFTLAFHALWRLGEFKLSKGNTLATILHLNDISMQQTIIYLTFRHSKMTKLCVGANLQIGAATTLKLAIQGVHSDIIHGSGRLRFHAFRTFIR